MKTRTLILIALVASLLLAVASFREWSTSFAQSSEVLKTDPPKAVKPVTASGGNYSLTVPAWKVIGSSSGEGYQLQGPESPSIVDQCCCIYLPCVNKH